MKLRLINTQPKESPKRMTSSVQNIINKTQFFKLICSADKSITYALEKPSLILIRNIYFDWLRYIHLKTNKSMPVYVDKKTTQSLRTKDLPFGIINCNELDFKKKNIEITNDSNKTLNSLELKLIIPQQDYMQHFIRWQRYRKYWWSSITTTPSLFSIGDIKQGSDGSEADIIARLPCGVQAVEQIKIKNYNNDISGSVCLSCSMSLERALFILLLDGSTNDPQDDYLRLHRKIAPYKMSFALCYEDIKNKQTLKDLAAFLYQRLNLGLVSASLPDFSISLNEQIRKNLQMGIPYTAILDETTLQNGILQMMSSSTMLKEQIHVADFHTYAGLICNVK